MAASPVGVGGVSLRGAHQTPTDVLVCNDCCLSTATYLFKSSLSVMNPALANFIISKTPDFILHPTKMAETVFTLNTGAKIPALGEFRDAL